MQPSIIEPNALELVFQKGQGGAFKPYGLFKFVVSADAPLIEVIDGIASMPEGVTMNPVSDFYTFNPTTDKALYIFNLSRTSSLLVERSLT